MATDAIGVLKAEIAGLEKQLDTRRRALGILAGTTPKMKPTPKAKPAPKAKLASATAGGGGAQQPPKALAVRIQEFLAANKGQKFTPAQLTDGLQKTDKTVSRDNIQRRLSDMVRTKKVKRADGRYSLA